MCVCVCFLGKERRQCKCSRYRPDVLRSGILRNLHLLKCVRQRKVTQSTDVLVYEDYKMSKSCNKAEASLTKMKFGIIFQISVSLLFI